MSGQAEGNVTAGARRREGGSEKQTQGHFSLAPQSAEAFHCHNYNRGLFRRCHYFSKREFRTGDPAGAYKRSTKDPFQSAAQNHAHTHTHATSDRAAEKKKGTRDRTDATLTYRGPALSARKGRPGELHNIT